MSEKIELKKINAPLLDGDYGQNVKDTFNNINDNFTTLANHDFIKGENGETLYIKELTMNMDINGAPLFKLNNEGIPVDDAGKPIPAGDERLSNPELLLNKIKKSTEAFNDNSDLKDDAKLINDTDIFDNLKWTDKISIIYKGVNKFNPIPVSSLSFVFLDARYAKNFSEVADLSQYADKTDYSCVITYEENDAKEFKKINSFPTLYYDNVLNTFAWKWQGSKTGMIARGPAGLNGKDGQLFTVNIDYKGGERPYDIVNFLNPDKSLIKNPWIPAKNFISDHEIHENAIAMVFDNTPADSTTYEYWVSPIKKDNYGNYYVTVNNTNKVELHYTAEMLKNILKNIDSTNTADTDLSCLFIPITKDNNTISAHAIYTESDKNNLVIKTTQNVNQVAKAPAEGSHKLTLGYNTNIEGTLNVTGKTTLKDLSVTNIIGDSLNINNKNIFSKSDGLYIGYNPNKYDYHIIINGDSDGGRLVINSGDIDYPAIISNGGININGKTRLNGAVSEGDTTIASGGYSHAEGWHTTAKGEYSHAEGYNTIATRDHSHVEGIYNKDIPTTSTTTIIHAVGVGIDNGYRENAHIITYDPNNLNKNGLHYIKGIGGYDGTQTDLSTVKDLASVISYNISRKSWDPESFGTPVLLPYTIDNKHVYKESIKIECNNSLIFPQQSITEQKFRIIKPTEFNSYDKLEILDYSIVFHYKHNQPIAAKYDVIRHIDSNNPINYLEKVKEKNESLVSIDFAGINIDESNNYFFVFLTGISTAFPNYQYIIGPDSPAYITIEVTLTKE